MASVPDRKKYRGTCVHCKVADSQHSLLLLFLDLSKTCENEASRVFWLVRMVIGMDDIIVTFYMVQRRGHAKNRMFQTKRVFF